MVVAAVDPGATSKVAAAVDMLPAAATVVDKVVARATADRKADRAVASGRDPVPPMVGVVLFQ
jgi:hypothetical protein